jgi:hypothetical protein
MRKYETDSGSKLESAVCNKCGKSLTVERGMIKEGYFSVDTGFGYFSKKDGCRHKFDLCEECFDELVDSLSVPAEILQDTELI